MPGLPFTISESIQHPANANAYTAKDVVGESVARILRFKFPVTHHRVGFWIMNPVLISSNPAAVSGSFKLLLFAKPVTVPVDNAVFAPTSNDMIHFLGFITFDTPIKVSTMTFYTPAGFSPLWGTLMTGDDSIYGVMLDDAGYTPASSEVFQPILNGQWEQ